MPQNNDPTPLRVWQAEVINEFADKNGTELNYKKTTELARLIRLKNARSLNQTLVYIRNAGLRVPNLSLTLVKGHHRAEKERRTEPRADDQGNTDIACEVCRNRGYYQTLEDDGEFVWCQACGYEPGPHWQLGTKNVGV